MTPTRLVRRYGSARTPLDPSRTYQTRVVLAGAYKASSPKALLTHTVDTATDDPICTRVKDAGSIVDEYGMAPEELHKPPTCPMCARRDPRFAKSS